MNKQSEAKEKQGYNPSERSCRNCKNVQGERTLDKWSREHPDSYNKYYFIHYTCGLGEFTVKALAVCNEFKTKA